MEYGTDHTYVYPLYLWDISNEIWRHELRTLIYRFFIGPHIFSICFFYIDSFFWSHVYPNK